MMRSLYIHDQPGWPDLHWDNDALVNRLAGVRHRQGRLIGRMEGLGFATRQEAVLDTLTRDTVDSSGIEGEILNPEQVRSSVARNLGLDIGGLAPVDRDVEGIVELMLDATRNYAQPLDAGRLFDWHASLFPTGRSGLSRIAVGAWRDDSSGPMQVMSGPIGRERGHFQAPAADRIPGEMESFLAWFNSETGTDGVLKAGLAHLRFVTIHPFADGNGRIARAITDMALAQAEASSQRFYSMSSQIRQGRNDYYRILERTQRGTTDVTQWMDWFLECLDRAIQSAESSLESVLAKARFWDRVAHHSLNDRQRLVINRLLGDFRGNMTTSKWATLAKCSPDTALRDISELVGLGVMTRNPAGGRSTSYSLLSGGEEL